LNPDNAPSLFALLASDHDPHPAAAIAARAADRFIAAIDADLPPATDQENA